MEKTEIRIVAGTLRGRKLQCLVHEGMRPTPQMVREALFSILGNAVPGRVFYDIFAGTGVVGIEAISRGASSAKLIEADAKQVREITKHVEQFDIADRVQIIRTDVYRWAERWQALTEDPVTLFLSPPFPDLDSTKLTTFLNLVNALWNAAPMESVLVIQAEDGFSIDRIPEPDAWDIRKYGRNLLLFRVKDNPAEATNDESAANSE